MPSEDSIGSEEEAPPSTLRRRSSSCAIICTSSFSASDSLPFALSLDRRSRMSLIGAPGLLAITLAASGRFRPQPLLTGLYSARANSLPTLFALAGRDIGPEGIELVRF